MLEDDEGPVSLRGPFVALIFAAKAVASVSDPGRRNRFCVANHLQVNLARGPAMIDGLGS